METAYKAANSLIPWISSNETDETDKLTAFLTRKSFFTVHSRT
jgi:hypothetical protein